MPATKNAATGKMSASNRVRTNIKAHTLAHVRRALLHFEFMPMLTEALGECDSVLDVGCGYSSPLGSIRKHFRSVGVDGHASSIEESRKAGIHDEYHNMDALDIDKRFAGKSLDCVMSMEIIEHMIRDGDLRHLRMIERIARKKVIAFTPNGFVPQEAYGENDWQVHKSGWTTREMEGFGYKVIGAR